MNFATHTGAGALIATLFLTTLSLPAGAQERAPLPDSTPARNVPETAPAGPVGLADGIEITDVVFDAPGDGSLWARGADWKMSFGADGATYYPRLGRGAPRNQPHAFSPASVTVGGQPLAFQTGVAASHAGDRVEIDRGAFVEAYELSAQSIEQLFVFPTLPRAGELVVRIPVGGDIAGVETAQGLEFRGASSRVSYSRAVAIDADGRRAAAPTRVEGGDIVIRVDAAFLATAAMPLVVDPTVLNITLDSVSDRDTYKPDACWDPINQVWLATYEQVYAGVDTDIFVKSLSSTGATLATAWVDFTSAGWARPRVAWNGALQRFLVVAERKTTIPTGVVGRTVQPNGTILTLGAQIDIGGTAAGHKRLPDVGGDPHPSQSYFCVVFEHELTAQETKIGYRLVDPTGVPFGTGPSYLPHVFNSPDTQASISRSNDTNQWLVAWRRNDPVYRGDIYGARIHWSGGLASGPFGITTFGILNDAVPSVSSPLRGTLQNLVAFQRNSLASTNFSVWVVPVNDTVASQQIDLTVLENSGMSAVAQVEPSIDSDGQHFLVAYAEVDPVFGNHDVFASDLFLSGGTIGITQAHVNVNHMGLSQRNPRVAAQRSASGGGQRYFLAYDIRQNDTEHDVSAALFDGYVGGKATPFCFGDGSGVACPCDNNGIAGRGCANSVDAYGGGLSASGIASTQNDTLQLHAVGMPNSTCLFFQGTVSNPATAFGDGLRCVGGTVIRLAARTIVGGGYTFPTGIDLPLSTTGGVPVDGGQRSYQVWYRNSAAFCTASTFNITSGVLVDWSR